MVEASVRRLGSDRLATSSSYVLPQSSRRSGSTSGPPSPSLGRVMLSCMQLLGERRPSGQCTICFNDRSTNAKATLAPTKPTDCTTVPALTYDSRRPQIANPATAIPNDNHSAVS